MAISSNKIRNIINLGGSLALTLPKEIGFNIGDCVVVDKIDENSCKVSKVEWNVIKNNSQ